MSPPTTPAPSPPPKPGGTPIAPPPRAPQAPEPAPTIEPTDPDAPKGYFVVVAGPPKYGKTTFASGAPRPRFVLADRNGLARLPRSIARDSVASWTDIINALTRLRDGKHNHGAVILDTIFKAESLLIKHLCEKDGKASLRQVGGGYGAGYEQLASEINRIVDIFFSLNDRGIHTIAISQIEAKTVKDPTLDDYERTALAVSKQTALIWSAAADVNMYVQPEIVERDRIDGGKDKEDRVKVDFTGKAICHVRPAAGIEAGNRLFLDSPITYSWAALEIGAAEGAAISDKLFAKLGTLSGVERAAADWRLNQAGWSRKAAEFEINK